MKYLSDFIFHIRSSITRKTHVLWTGEHHNLHGLSRPRGFHPRPLPSRVEDWRVSVGRLLCSLLARPFVCECHNITTMLRFQPPPRQTQRAELPHWAFLLTSHQALCDRRVGSAFNTGYITNLIISIQAHGSI